MSSQSPSEIHPNCCQELLLWAAPHSLRMSVSERPAEREPSASETAPRLLGTSSETLSRAERSPRSPPPRERLQPVFGYGSNNIEQLRERCLATGRSSAAIPSSKALLPDHERIFCGSSPRWDGASVASVRKTKGGFRSY